MLTKTNPEGTGALDKALDVLDAVGATPAGLSQAELGQRLALPRTTLYRLLGALTKRGLLRRDPLRRVYGLGMRCFEYARTAYSMPDLVAAAGTELRALRDMTGETAYLGTLDGLEVVALERCDGAHDYRSHSALGARKPLHCTSQGKAILAALPAAHRDALVKELPLTALTPRSITDRRRLQAELRLTATRGWSIDDEEIVPGVRCCGAAIVDAAGQVRGAISVAGPAFRLTSERVDLLGPELAQAARRIGAQLATAAPAAASGDVQVVAGEWAFEGALPVWSDTARALFWADALAPALHRASATGDVLLARLDSPIRAVLSGAPGSGDALVVQTEAAWHRVGHDGAVSSWPEGPPRSFSALCRAPDGVAWGCLAERERWCVSSLSPEGLAPGGWHLNEPATALAWDATGQRLVIAAAGSGSLFVAERGGSHPPSLRRLATVPKGSGLLSGLALDHRGGIWTALRGGWSVVRFEADGSLDRVVAMPVPCPTALCFAGGAKGPGPERRTLFITSARDAVGRAALDAAPLSGRLFSLVDVG